MEAMLTPEPSRPKGQRLMARRCEDLKTEIIEAQRLAVDEEGRILVWAGAAVVLPASTSAPAPEHAPLVYTPQHLAEKILTAKSTMAGERKHITVLSSSRTSPARWCSV